MASNRIDRNSKAKKVMRATPAPAPRSVFGPPLLLVGEDAAAFEQLRAQFRVAVRPVDIIEEMFVSDVVDLQWEILRWRRVKTSLLRTSVRSALKGFLSETLEFESDREAFESIDAAEDEQVIVLVQAYARGEPGTIAQVNDLLAARGQTMDDLMADELIAVHYHGEINLLTQIERINRLIAIAEVRRDACLREVDRHRAALGEALRRNIENGEFEVIEPPSEGRNAA